MDLGFAAVDNQDEWGEDSPKMGGKLVIETPPIATLAPQKLVAPVEAPLATGPPAGKMHTNPRTRYFIIKCNNHKNLVASIQNNVWATQKHNETKLNEALRVSAYVVLLFSVNMSGSFQGYARMIGKCGQSQTADPFNGFGALFDIKWLKLHDLDFNDILHITNEWNNGLSVKISRDGQELPNSVGKSICALIDQGVWRADPGNFVVDDEYPSEIPVDAPPPETPLPDSFVQKRGNWKGQKNDWSKDWKGGRGDYGNDNRWRNEPYGGSGGKGNEKGGKGGYIDGGKNQGYDSWYSSTPSSNAYQGGGSSSSWDRGRHHQQPQQVVVTQVAQQPQWGQPVVHSVAQPVNVYANGWGGETSASSGAGGMHRIVQQPATIVQSYPAQTHVIHQPVGGQAVQPGQPANTTYVALSSPPAQTQQQPAQSPPAQAQPPATPDFVNMSYDQYLQWYNRQGSGNRGSGKDDELTTSDED